MEPKHYLGYIAHFVKNVDQLTPTDDYRDFFRTNLGTPNPMSAPDAKVRDVARWMYRAYVASMYVRYSPYYLMTKLSSKECGDLVNLIVEITDRYGLYKSVAVDISVSASDKEIKNKAIDYKSILSKYASPSKSTAAPKPKRVATKTAARKTTKKSSSTVAKKASPAPKKAPVKTAKRPVSKTSGAAKKTAKSCAEYKVPELKEMAKTKGVKGFSKMNKNALCDALGV